jgi:ABC-type phosphate transport system substrate-binding protein
MKRLRLASLLGVFAFAMHTSSALAGVTVIAHEGLKNLDESTISRIYMGKIIEVNGSAVNPVNLMTGSNTRTQFMNQVLGKEDDSYIAYWVVRRSIGKGVSPKEFGSDKEVIEYVKSTPGAIGYIDSSESKPGLNVLLTK